MPDVHLRNISVDQACMRFSQAAGECAIQIMQMFVVNSINVCLATWLGRSTTSSAWILLRELVATFHISPRFIGPSMEERVTVHDKFWLTGRLTLWAMGTPDGLKMENTTIASLTLCASVSICSLIAKQFATTYEGHLDTHVVVPELPHSPIWTSTHIGKLSCVVSFDTSSVQPRTCDVLDFCVVALSQTEKGMEWS